MNYLYDKLGNIIGKVSDELDANEYGVLKKYENEAKLLEDKVDNLVVEILCKEDAGDEEGVFYVW